MRKITMHTEKLRELDNWDAYLKQNSGLPGPRANLELIKAVAEEGNNELILRYVSMVEENAPVNTPEVFLAVCGTVGLGRLLKEGKTEYMQTLRKMASDTRWRIREGVAMALQIYGETQMEQLLNETEKWSKGNNYEKRAAVAALCEPKLLRQKEQVARVLKILNNITNSIQEIEERKDESYKALRKGLAYCWSVAIVAYPNEGKKMFEKWFASKDKDIRWIIKENLKKNRMKKMDEAWVERCKTELGLN